MICVGVVGCVMFSSVIFFFQQKAGKGVGGPFVGLENGKKKKNKT